MLPRTARLIFSAQPLFFSPMDKRDEANAARARLRAGNSDLMTNVNAFTTFTQVKAKEGNRAARDFCEVRCFQIIGNGC